MELQEILIFADDNLFAKTGKHLDDLQETILSEALQGRKYAQVAKERDRSEGYVRVAATELWRILSDSFGEEVSKGNVRSILERSKFSYSAAISQNYVIVNNVNVSQEKARSPKCPPPSPDTSTEPQINLDDAPAILSCYNRTTELNTLEHWLVQDRCRIVELLGMSGIGKTALSLRLIDQIKSNFDYIIYQTLCFAPTLETTLTNLLENFVAPTEIPPQIESKISQILKYLRQHRCLIVLDDVQMLFSPGKLTGEYQASLENYPLFFKRIAETEHHSCFLLISAEQLQDFTQLRKGDRSVRSLVLGGLGIAAKEILKAYELSDEDQWERLINLYQGNPLWLEIMAMMIQDLFAGQVSEFLQCESLILADSLRSQLGRQWQRLTQTEQAIIIQLKDEDLPVTLPQILKTGSKQSISASSDVLTAIQSLRRRFLIDKIEQGEDKFFKLNPVYQEYLQGEAFP